MSGMPSPDIADVGTMLTYLRPHGARFAAGRQRCRGARSPAPSQEVTVPILKPQMPTHAPHTQLCIVTLHPQGSLSKRERAPHMPCAAPHRIAPGRGGRVLTCAGRGSPS